ncbi:restriction endonuclease [Streptomyces lydicus]
MLRQLDALVQGQLAGQPVSIAIEAKRYGRSVSIGTVDEFIGKMLDVGCDRGVLYAAGGFTDGALARASNARNPAVGCVHLAPSVEASVPDAVNTDAGADDLPAPDGAGVHMEGDVHGNLFYPPEGDLVVGRVVQAGRDIELPAAVTAVEARLDRLVGRERTADYVEWLARLDVPLYRY